MAEFKKNPKWLKKLRKLMKSDAQNDRVELKQNLEKLKFKANELKAKIDACDNRAEQDVLIKKLELVNKHRKKGMKRLLEGD